jgi:hypothetical protein
VIRQAAAFCFLSYFYTRCVLINITVHTTAMAHVPPANPSLCGKPRQSVLLAACRARALASSAAVEARVVEMEALGLGPDYFTQTDSDTTLVFSDGGQRVIVPVHRRRAPIVYTAAEASENERRTRMERKRRKLLGRRASSLVPAEARAWLKWLRHLNGGHRLRGMDAFTAAKNAEDRRVRAPLLYGYGLQRMYVADL